MEYYQANALRITQLMKQNHMTAYELAKQSGIPHSTISLILSGKTKNPRSLTMINIGRGFNICLLGSIIIPNYLTQKTSTIIEHEKSTGLPCFSVYSLFCSTGAVITGKPLNELVICAIKVET